MTKRGRDDRMTIRAPHGAQLIERVEREAVGKGPREGSLRKRARGANWTLKIRQYTKA